MKATRPAFLIALVLVVALITWAVLEVAYVSLPPLPWTAVPTLLLLALGEAFTGWNVLRRIRRKPGTRPVEPLVVARMAALGKASAHAAAVLAGVFAGFALGLADALDKQTPRDDFFVSLGTFLAAVVLVGAAFFLEYACRVPNDPEDQARDRGRSRA
jgi:CheY-like chemotaxis protein